jgi:manganese transport protein
MVPAVVIVALGVNPTQSLVLSQVVLSLVLPIPVVALIYFTRRRDIMGILVNRLSTMLAAGACAAVILLLNLVLLFQTAGGTLPGLG